VYPNQLTMADVSSLSNDELRNALIEHGQQVGPIMQSTRKVYEKKLMKLMAGDANNSMLNESAASIPDEPIVRTPISPRKKKTAAHPVEEEEHGMASSDEERGEESMRYLDEEEEEAYRRHLSPSNSPVFANEERVEGKKNGGVSTVGLILALVLFFIFAVFLLMRTLEVEGGEGNREEL
ncbi:hypothetical protein PMAYCL1PPCAC_07469, partial [Pristionchus mayeri]